MSAPSRHASPSDSFTQNIAPYLVHDRGLVRARILSTQDIPRMSGVKFPRLMTRQGAPVFPKNSARNSLKA
jgi:hypothetical protein